MGNRLSEAGAILKHRDSATFIRSMLTGTTLGASAPVVARQGSFRLLLLVCMVLVAAVGGMIPGLIVAVSCTVLGLILASVNPVSMASSLLFLLIVGIVIWQEGKMHRLSQQLNEANDLLLSGEKRLGMELDSIMEVQEAGTQYLQDNHLDNMLNKLLNTAIVLSDSDFGNIQFLSSDNDHLEIVAHRGFPTWWIDYWNKVSQGHGVCGTALERRERIIVDDVEKSPIFAGSPALQVQLNAGVRAVQSTPLISRAGHFMGMLSTHRLSPGQPSSRALRYLDLLARHAADILEKAKADADLREAKEDAIAGNQAKSDFLASMSHEIRTPLGIILGYADIIFNNSDSNELDPRHYADTIRRSAQHLLALINDVLDLSKVEAGKLEIERRDIPFTTFFKDILVQFQAQAKAKDLYLRSTIVGSIPSVVTTDETRLRQILVNVVGNALKFTDIGGISIEVFQQPSSGALCFRVKDTGCGIAAEAQDRIFQPFTQAEKYISRRYGGTGLGLGLSRKLANHLGGDIVLKSSEVGKGSIFEILIDSGDNGHQPWLDNMAFQKLLKTCESTGHDLYTKILQGRHVLVVDDVEENQILVRLLLESAGAKVTIACDGAEAVDQATAGNFDVILMDIQMPVMNGYEAATRLRDNGYMRPIIALTAHAMKGELERCIAAGYDGYLSKPVRKADLLREIMAYLSDSQAGPGAEINLATTELSASEASN